MTERVRVRWLEPVHVFFGQDGFDHWPITCAQQKGVMVNRMGASRYTQLTGAAGGGVG